MIQAEQVQSNAEVIIPGYYAWGWIDTSSAEPANDRGCQQGALSLTYIRAKQQDTQPCPPFLRLELLPLYCCVQMPGYMRTHPLSSDRVARVKQELPAAYQLFDNSGCSRKQDLMRRAMGFFPDFGGR